MDNKSTETGFEEAQKAPEGLPLRWLKVRSGIDALDAFRDPEQTSLSQSAFACAARVAEEYKLGLWVREKDLVGASVRTPRLIAEFQRRLEAQPPPVQLRSVPETENNTGRNWAYRWRRSQGGVFGKIRTQEPIATFEIREKDWGRAAETMSSANVVRLVERPKTRH